MQGNLMNSFEGKKFKLEKIAGNYLTIGRGE